MQNLYSLHSLAFFHAGQLAVIEETSNPVALRRLGTRKVHVVAQRGVRSTILQRNESLQIDWNVTDEPYSTGVRFKALI